MVSSVFKVATATPQLNLLSTNVPAVFYIGTQRLWDPMGCTGKFYLMRKLHRLQQPCCRHARFEFTFRFIFFQFLKLQVHNLCTGTGFYC